MAKQLPPMKMNVREEVPVAVAVERRVRAHQPGYYGSYREVGAVFTIKNGAQDFSDCWMEDVADDSETVAAPASIELSGEPAPGTDSVL